MQKPTSHAQETEFTEVDVRQLLFDPGNPRFGGESTKYTLSEIEKEQGRIQDILEGDPHYALRLLDSFRQNGFIRYEPLVVRQMGQRFVVIEGNRRLAAVRHILRNSDGLFSQQLIQKFQKIPVLLFHQAEDQSHLRDMRSAGEKLAKQFEDAACNRLKRKLTGVLHNLGAPRKSLKTAVQFKKYLKQFGFDDRVILGEERDGGLDILWFPPFGASPVAPNPH